jgi:small subunit ribosomal protein S21
MLIIPIKEGENIERALKRFKKKFDRTGAVKEIRARKQFTKPSIIRREELKKAAYIQRLRAEEE